MVIWLFERGFKVSLGPLSWYGNSYGTDFDDSEIASFASIVRVQILIQ